MDQKRRKILQLGLAAASAAAPVSALADSQPDAAKSPSGAAAAANPDHVGVLYDTTLCIGCRECEAACNRRNNLPRTPVPFSDREVFRTPRRPSDTAFTVVNQYQGSPSTDQAAVPYTYCKVQCMHCLYPSCVSACIVGALTKAADGSVVYNATICLGCRYCQVACPFEVPAYEFNEPLKPRVRKCEFCTDREKGTGANPACAAACPTEALVFGRRADLLATAKERIASRPARYLNHVYGEFEVGGTSWLYLVGRPVAELGLLPLPTQAPPARTEAIQHGIFRYGLLPTAFYGVLAGVMWLNHRRRPDDEPGIGEVSDEASGGQAARDEEVPR
jgi:Fe-S-cluster-containing dehydrogenase component